MAKPVFDGYTHDQLKRAFDTVADPDDWKAPIYALMQGEAVLAVAAAIRYFTATNPKVQLDTRRMLYLVTSEGYRNGPAGP